MNFILEKENKELKKTIERQLLYIAELQSQNAELRKQLTDGGKLVYAEYKNQKETIAFLKYQNARLKEQVAEARTAFLIITEEYEQDFAISRCAKKMCDRAKQALQQLSNQRDVQ